MLSQTTEEKKEKAEVPAVKPTAISLHNGIRPQDTAELMRFAQLYYDAKLAPKAYDTPQKIAIGMAMCMELGRPVLLGLQDLAPINNTVRLFGTGAMAQIQASGFLADGYPKESWEGTPFKDDWTYVSLWKRTNGRTAEGRFTWAEAKMAGFDNPKTRDGRDDIWSPWKRFPKRMMVWKSRAWPMADLFGDVLKMGIYEDMVGVHNVVEMSRTEEGSFEAQPEPTLDEKVQAAAKAKTETPRTEDVPAGTKSVPSDEEGSPFDSETGSQTAPEVPKNAPNEEKTAPDGDQTSPNEPETGSQENEKIKIINVIEWLTVSRPSSSVDNARTWIQAYGQVIDEVNALPDKQKKQLHKKAAKVREFLREQEAEKPGAPPANPNVPHKTLNDPPKSPPPAAADPRPEHTRRFHTEVLAIRDQVGYERYIAAIDRMGHQSLNEIPRDPEAEAKALASLKAELGLEDATEAEKEKPLSPGGQESYAVKTKFMAGVDKAEIAAGREVVDFVVRSIFGYENLDAIPPWDFRKVAARIVDEAQFRGHTVVNWMEDEE